MLLPLGAGRRAAERVSSIRYHAIRRDGGGRISHESQKLSWVYVPESNRPFTTVSRTSHLGTDAFVSLLMSGARIVRHRRAPLEHARWLASAKCGSPPSNSVNRTPHRGAG